MARLLAVLVLVTAAVATQAIVCPPNYCSSVQCGQVLCDPDEGRLQANGGFCGCCDVCIKYIEEGDFCRPNLLLGVPVTRECRPGLVCHPAEYKCVRQQKEKSLTQCQQLQQQVDSQDPPMLGAFRPDCDEDGSFSAKQCRGSVCYCVTQRGERIRDYQANIAEAANMMCGCARQQHQIEMSGVIGRWVNCDAVGNYEPVQCVGSQCFCAHPHTGLQTTDQVVGIWEMDKLLCDTKTKRQSLTQCQQLQQQVDSQDPPMLGAFRPDCDEDGSFSAKQCRGSKCYCVTKQGDRIRDYEANLWDAENMMCGCARQQHEIEMSGVIGRWVNCDAVGNYEPVQCVGSQCFCAHPHTGLQTTDQVVGIWEMDKLLCDTKTKRQSLTECQQMQQQVDSQSPPLDGAFRPDCDADGSFSAKQCQGSVCYCVTKHGDKIKDYATSIGQAQDMMCQCAREERQIQESGVIGRWVNCDRVGNFEPVQCMGSVCYCAHPHTGLQTSTGTVNIWELNHLNC